MTHNSNKSDSRVAEWLRYAQDDELNAGSILKHKDGAPSGPCFLSNQMTEKYLKALLVFHNQPVPKIHDLLQLETLLSPFEGSIGTAHSDIILLNRYFISTRYPGDYPEFSWEDAQAAYDAALRVKNFVLGQLGRAENQ